MPSDQRKRTPRRVAWPEGGTKQIWSTRPGTDQAHSQDVFLPDMDSSAVRTAVEALPTGSFVRPSEFGSAHSTAARVLGRLVAAGELVRVRRGLYFKGAKTALGMTRPHPLDLALLIGGSGSGPAGFSAASMLGLSTQVPSSIEIAVPATKRRLPKAPEGVTYSKRDDLRQNSSSLPPKLPSSRCWQVGQRQSKLSGATWSRLLGASSMTVCWALPCSNGM